jgi:saccharopine dehydrogenase-like NADP-dependent oxidoreductase
MSTCAAVFLLAAGLAPEALSQPEGIRAQLEQSTATSSSEKREFATDANKEMEAAVKKLSKAMADAEREREAVRLNCLSKKLSSARTLSEVAESASQAMNVAIDGNDLDKAEHEFRKIAVALQKTREFAAEGEACLGDAGSSPGVTSVVVSQGDLDAEDDTEPIDDGSLGLLGVDPPETSPFQ